MTVNPTMITTVIEYIASHPDTRIQLLRNKDVIHWLYGDTSFLATVAAAAGAVGKSKAAVNAKWKECEDAWGQAVLRTRRPDLKLDGQWTNKFGEHLCEEILALCGKTVTKPACKNHYKPDAEVDDAVWEAKAQTYYTSGTAGEKILGVPFKYAEVPDLYAKPLKILCMGGAERVCRESYGNLAGPRCTAQKTRFLEFFKTCGFTYIGATEILTGLACGSPPPASTEP